MNKLHWLICGFEGAVLVMNSDLFPDLPSPRRQQIADIWFSVMFARFKRDARMTFNSELTDDVERACEKLRGATGQLTFERVLAETSALLALSSPDRARAYFSFWSEMMTRRQQRLRKTGS